MTEKRKKEYKQGTLPVLLLTADKKALIAGGGKVALRKSQNLLAAGMKVTVIAPDLVSGFADLKQNTDITIKTREFKESDIKGNFLIIAATGNRAINRKIQNLAAEQKIIAMSVDGNWTTSDFIFPATYRDDDIVLSVSTNGKACRRSKMIKNSLARHIETVNSTDLYCIGTDHTLMSIDERSEISLNSVDIEKLGSLIMQIWGIHEFLILTTCNRIEFWALASTKLKFEPILKQLLPLKTQYYRYTGLEAFKHSVMLAAGMKSQLKGENQIVAQMKQAVKFSHEQQWSNGAIQEWLGSALRISKQIRNLSSHKKEKQSSIEDIALECAVKNTKINHQKITVIGTGKIATGILKRCIKQFPKAHIKIVWNKTKPDISMYNSSDIQLCSIKNLAEGLQDSTLIFSAISVKKPLVTQEQSTFFTTEKVLAIDCSVPRSIEKNISLPNLKIMDMDEINASNDTDTVQTIPDKDTKSFKEIEKNLYEKIVDNFQNWNALQ